MVREWVSVCLLGSVQGRLWLLWSRAVVLLILGSLILAAPPVQAAPPTPEEARRAAAEAKRAAEEARRRAEWEEARRLDIERRRKFAEEQRRLVEKKRRRAEAILRTYREKSLCLAGTDTAYSVLRKLYTKFRKGHPDAPMYLDYAGGGTGVGIRALAGGRAEAAVIGHTLTEKQQQQLKAAFPDPKRQPKEVPFTKAALMIVVHKANPTYGLTYQQIEDIYRGKTADWSALGDFSGKITRLGTAPAMLSWAMFTQQILKGKIVKLPELPFRKEGYKKEEIAEHYRKLREKHKATGGKPFAMHRSDQKILDEVAKDRNAIGYCIVRSVASKPKGVRIVKVVPPGQKEPVALTRENLLFDKYPLQLTMKFLVHPDASEVPRGFVKFACSELAEPIVRTCGLHPISEREVILRLRRLAAMKAGKGVPIRGVGSMGGAAVMRDLAVEYVKAKEVVQMACRPATSELTAVGYFVHSKDRELLVLDGPISEKAKKLHGKKWDFLEPETHVLASGRGIAICVNSMNKLGSLTVEQVRHLFSKKTTSWRDVTGAEVKIKRYGLAGTDPAARVFYNRINPPAVCARPDTRLGTQAVLAALSRDPHGIAFVDAAAANDLLGAAGAKSGIKVLSIGATPSTGSGQAGKATSPTAANVKAGKYPISQQLTLHLSPRASQTTRDFVKFVLSGAADEVFTKHGLTPVPRAGAKK